MNVVTVGLSEKIQCIFRVMKFKIYCRNPKSKFPNAAKFLLKEASNCTLRTSLYYGHSLGPKETKIHLNSATIIRTPQ